MQSTSNTGSSNSSNLLFHISLSYTFCFISANLLLLSTCSFCCLGLASPKQPNLGILAHGTAFRWNLERNEGRKAEKKSRQTWTQLLLEGVLEYKAYYKVAPSWSKGTSLLYLHTEHSLAMDHFGEGLAFQSFPDKISFIDWNNS